MIRIVLVISTALSFSGFDALAQDHGRIKKKPPTPADAERIVSDMAMSDGTLQKGDIVTTNRGFFLFADWERTESPAILSLCPIRFHRKGSK